MAKSNNQTLLKVNLLTTVVTQSGNVFLCSDIRNGTSGKIQNREVGACYIKARLQHTYGTEFHINDLKQLLDLVDKFKAFKLSKREELYQTKSGLVRNSKEDSISDLLKFVTDTNLAYKKQQSSKRIKLSPYSIMTKITIQHFVPKDLIGTMKYPERYIENAADYSSNQQVYEIRIPLVPSLDSEEAIERIFLSYKNFIDSLNPQYRSEQARSTRQSLEYLVGEDRYKSIVTKQHATLDELLKKTDIKYEGPKYDETSREGEMNHNDRSSVANNATKDKIEERKQISDTLKQSQNSSNNDASDISAILNANKELQDKTDQLEDQVNSILTQSKTDGGNNNKGYPTVGIDR